MKYYFILFLLLATNTGYCLDTLRVGIYNNEPLVFQSADGKVSGIYIDILEFISSKEGWITEYVPGTWSQCLERLKLNEIDLLTGIAFTVERELSYNFNQIDVVTNWAQIYLPEDSEILSLMDLSGKNIAVQKGDIYFQALSSLESLISIDSNYIEVPDYQQILQLVSTGKVDAGLVPRIFGQYNESDYRIKRSPINFSPVELRFAAPHGQGQKILEVIDGYLNRFKANKNSIYYRSLNEWIEGVNKLVLPKWINPVWAVFIVSIIIVIIVIINFILRWQVRRRTEVLKQTIEAKEKIEGELRVASIIQMELLPDISRLISDTRNIDICAVIEPAREVGGDLYDFFLIDDEHLCFMIGDVSDKGVPAALFMARTKTLAEILAKNNREPNEILMAVNKELSENNESMMFVTLFCGILDLQNGTVEYTIAGHNPPCIIRKDGKLEILPNTGDTAIGLFNTVNFKSDSLTLQPGDIIFLYTDGVTEAFNLDKEEFSEERLYKILSNLSVMDVRDITNTVMARVKDFSNSVPQSDDITILTLKYKYGVNLNG